MKPIRPIRAALPSIPLAFVAIAGAIAISACDTTPKRDATGQTTTTGAPSEASGQAERLGEDLDRAGEKLGEAAKKAATGLKEEAKDEWQKLDVHVETNGAPAHDPGPRPRTKEPAPAKYP